MTTTFRVTTGYYLEECGLVTRHGRTRTQQVFVIFSPNFAQMTISRCTQRLEVRGQNVVDSMKTLAGKESLFTEHQRRASYRYLSFHDHVAQDMSCG